ncbi:MAG TPA: phenylalanine--tRNA ligase subunit beta [Kofleriaceae bacterium]|nr:phenylalanine--tRNA ligase subunit beta [Kofleriaceae bacterium]
MRAVWSWLRELVDLDRELTAEEGARLLTGIGLEVEGIDRLDRAFRGVVVAEVVAREKHPQADKLTVVDVIDATGGAATRVVCGAPNVPAPGGRVLWARPGARLEMGSKGAMDIGVRPLKGVESAGMLCSETELALGDDGDGIVVLAGDEAQAAPGTDAYEALGLRGDAVFEISVPSNRGDALGHLGLARELAAAAGGRLRMQEVDLAPVTDASLDATRLARVDIEAPDGCPRYVARVIDGLTVGPSPGWLRRRLRAVGVRPISNLVDITNYVLFEVGHPLHAFDHRRVSEGRILVRRARAGETMKTLDGQERTLVPDDLLICDARGPVALAGVMGGLDSEVAPDTTRVLLEAAGFDSRSVRRTAKRLGLHSEASHRFERGVDADGAEHASRRAARLLAELGGGRVAAGVVDAYPRPPVPVDIRLRPARASSLAGIPISAAVASRALARLGVQVRADGQDLVAVAPTWRADLTREVDLIEEVMRLHGYDNVPATLPRLAAPPSGRADRRPDAVRAALTALGMSEAITYGFTSPARLEALGLPDGDRRRRVVALQNPMSADHGIMRTSLLPNLLAAVARNLKYDVPDVALFEVGSVFLANGDGALPDEPVRAAGVLCGRRAGWLAPGAEVDFSDARAAVERVAEELGIGGDRLRLEADAGVPYLHPGATAAILVDGARVGEVGEVHPDVRARLDVGPRCFAFDLDLATLPQPDPRQMRPIPRYPAVTRDVSLFVAADLPAGRVRDLVRDDLIEAVTVLEEYRDPARVPAGQKGLLWSITYRSPEKTLTDAEVDARHEKLVAALVEKLAATRR